MEADFDMRVRMAAFQFLEEQTKLHGEVLPRTILEKGFLFAGERVPLIAPQGIFTPRILELPLSFYTTPPSLRHEPPYKDEIGNDGAILYRYRGSDPMHRDNVGLREAMRRSVPLIYLYGVIPGQYLPTWPVYIVGDQPAELTFLVSVDDKMMLPADGMIREARYDEKRRYITVETQRRLHQQSFRLRVLSAYRDKCAICELHHRELLEAAHILSDKHPLGQPVIPNGISLCKLHHAAFDNNILGISPDYNVEIRRDILAEHDGPMLKAGLQSVHGQKLHVPRADDFRPNREFLDLRYADFKKAG